MPKHHHAPPDFQYLDRALRNISPPIISGNTHTADILTTTRGIWNGFPFSYSYQWYSGATPVGTNSNSYTIVSGDIGNQISVAVTASGLGDAMTAVSASTAVVTSGASNPLIILLLDMSQAFPRMI